MCLLQHMQQLFDDMCFGMFYLSLQIFYFSESFFCQMSFCGLISFVKNFPFTRNGKKPSGNQ